MFMVFDLLKQLWSHESEGSSKISTIVVCADDFARLKPDN
jgi:hypothetical protein